MRIEQLKTTPDRAGRYMVLFDNGIVMRLYRQTVEDFSLCPGMELSRQQYGQLVLNAQQVSARMRAVRIISATGVSKSELENRLVQKGESPDQAKQAVEWLEELHLVDDKKIAEQIVHSCISKGYGLARARQVLYEKRVPKELWDEALADYPDQEEKLQAFLRARISDASDPRQVKRAVDALLRRGHSYRAIREALNNLSLESEEISEDV